MNHLKLNWLVYYYLRSRWNEINQWTRLHLRTITQDTFAPLNQIYRLRFCLTSSRITHIMPTTLFYIFKLFNVPITYNIVLVVVVVVVRVIYCFYLFYGSNIIHPLLVLLLLQRTSTEKDNRTCPLFDWIIICNF